MKKQTTLLLLVLTLFTAMYQISCKPDIEPYPFPTNALNSCTVTDSLFNTWFNGGKATENGLVKPVNSVTFEHNNNCNFYQWSMQMFLWMTSPVDGFYAYGNTVMESPVFYDVSPENNKVRTLIPHQQGSLLRAYSTITEFGTNKLPLFKTKDGRMLELLMHAEGADNFKVSGEKGLAMELGSVEMQNNKAVFKDKKGKLIQAAKLAVDGLSRSEQVAHGFNINGLLKVFDQDGNVIETEEGQAGSNAALMAQNKSLVYYITMVNDVYAYYCSGVVSSSLNPNYFPVSQPALDSVLHFAKKNGWPAPKDSNALAIELKTSWVEAVNLADSNSYVTIYATIPTYSQVSNTQWLPVGQRKAKLAMVGMHIVGGLNNHPEMVWASFEHINNAPNAAYSYLNTQSVVVNVPQDTGTKWLFSNNAADINPNTQFMNVSSDTINAISTYSIAPSNVLRTKPFCVASDGNQPNQEDVTAAASNSELLSINNNIRQLLVGKDVRKNYFLLGATWTNSGAAPNGQSYSASNTANGVAIGTSQLANSTMETYFQGGTIYTKYGSCFSCHSGKVNNVYSLNPNQLSHVFNAISALPAGNGQ